MTGRESGLNNRVLTVHGYVIGDGKVAHVPCVQVFAEAWLPLIQRKVAAEQAALVTIQNRLRLKTYNPYLIAVDLLAEPNVLQCDSTDVKKLVFECFRVGPIKFLREGRAAGIYNQRRDEIGIVLRHLQLDKKHVTYGCHICRTDAIVLAARRRGVLYRFDKIPRPPIH